MNFSSPWTWGLVIPVILFFGGNVVPFTPYIVWGMVAICVVTVAARNLSTEDTRPNV